MRILRFSSPKVPDDIPLYQEFSRDADRHLAVMQGRELQLYDLQDPQEPVVRISDVINHALAQSRLVVCHRDGTLALWECRNLEWRMLREFPAPTTPEARSPLPETLMLSNSGRYLLVESDGIPTGPETWSVSRAFLLDIHSGEVRRTFDLEKQGVSASFEMMPSGQEVLFISADSYMSVQMVDCDTGQTIHQYTAQEPWDFCHTSYQLSPDATRLFTFGCIWACPWEFRLYDATPWTAGQPESQGFPLPLLFPPERGYFHLGYEEPAAPLPTEDGAFTLVALIQLDGLPASGSANEEKLLSELDPAEADIYRAVTQFPRSGSALLVHRVDPVSASVKGWAVTPISVRRAEHPHIHILTNHRALMISDRIQLVDGITGRLTDLGPTNVPKHWFYSDVTPDGETLVLWWSEGAQ